MPTLPKPASLGVTGIVTLADAAAIAALTPTPWQRLDRRLMVGLLASAKTARGDAVPNRRYPPAAALPALVAALPDWAWPVLHVNAPRSEPLAPFLQGLLDACPGVQGVQLNLVHPDLEGLAAVRASHPHIEVILQVNRPSVPSLAPAAVDTYVRRYAGLVDHVLLDLSGGTGRGLSIDWVRSVLEPFGRAWLRTHGIRPGLAGGFGPGCGAILTGLTSAIDPLLLVECSLDAESHLRVPVADPLPNERHQDALDADRMQRYLRDASLGCANWATIAQLEREELRLALTPGTIVRLREAPAALGVVTVPPRTATGPAAVARVMPLRTGIPQDQASGRTLWTSALPGVGAAVALEVWAEGPVPLDDLALVPMAAPLPTALLDDRARLVLTPWDAVDAGVPSDRRGTGPDADPTVADPWTTVWARTWHRG